MNHVRVIWLRILTFSKDLRLNYFSFLFNKVRLNMSCSAGFDLLSNHLDGIQIKLSLCTIEIVMRAVPSQSVRVRVTP